MVSKGTIAADGLGDGPGCVVDLTHPGGRAGRHQGDGPSGGGRRGRWSFVVQWSGGDRIVTGMAALTNGALSIGPKTRAALEAPGPPPTRRG